MFFRMKSCVALIFLFAMATGRSHGGGHGGGYGGGYGRGHGGGYGVVYDGGSRRCRIVPTGTMACNTYVGTHCTDYTSLAVSCKTNLPIHCP
jgi:hypothetical protein